MGDKKKHKDRDRSQDKKKSKKKKDQKQKDREKNKKKKDKKNRSESSSSSGSSSSSSERSRSRDKISRKKKKEKQKQKEEKLVINVPFAMSQPAPIIPLNPLAAIRPVGGIMIPPPAPAIATTTTTTKPKTKQYHIFKLLPKLPLGAVTIGRTIYSSSLLSAGFESKMLTDLCEDLQKSAKAQGAKKMSNIIGKVRQQITTIQLSGQKRNETNEQKSKNQFETLNEVYYKQMDKIRKQILNKNLSILKI